MNVPLRCAAGLLAITLGSVASAAPAVYPKVKHLMTGTVEPASKAVFAVARNPPASDEEWQAVEHSAQMLVEAGEKLRKLAPVPSAVWRTQARILVVNAGMAAAAARARDQEALNKASETVFETCAGCHKVFPVNP